MRPYSALIRIALIAPVLSATYPPLQAAEAAAPELPAQVDAIFQKWNHADTPGCALGVRQGANQRFFRAYGSADLEQGTAIDPDTSFEAGSVSKQFTAASALILAEHGKLALDDDVRRYIPELPDYGSPITIAQLLGHTSGLREWEGVAEIAGWPRTSRHYTQRDVLEMAARQKSLNFRSGTEYSYSNTGYVLLALIVERVSGESLAAFSGHQLFEPLGMAHTRWRTDFRAVVRGRAVAYDADSSGYHQFMPFDDVIGSGGLITTTADLLTWNDALDAGRLGRFVTAELQRSSVLTDGRAISYARGLKVSTRGGFREIWHDGETAGYEAFLTRYPDQHLSIALLCNTGAEADTTSLADRITDLLLPQPGVSLSSKTQKATPPAAVLGPYAGTFFSVRTGFPMRLQARDGGLQRVSDGSLFSAVGAGLFRDVDSTVTFRGHDRFVRAFADGRRAVFQRVQTWDPGPKELLSFAGRYRSEEALATYVVRIVDGHLVIAQDDRQWNAVAPDVLSFDTFSTPHAVYHFIRNSNGKPISLEISNLGVYSLPFRRMSH
jgi:CubicO group peptidase (beta-lactamase class C family)